MNRSIEKHSAVSEVSSMLLIFAYLFTIVALTSVVTICLNDSIGSKSVNDIDDKLAMQNLGATLEYESSSKSSYRR